MPNRFVTHICSFLLSFLPPFLFFSLLYISDEEIKQERVRILKESYQMKQMVGYYMHPEKPIQLDSCACTRCYFDRPSAPERLSQDEANEIATLLEDAKTLKQLAIDYSHPELPVVTNVSDDGTVFARCYFDRPSGIPMTSPEEEEERIKILEDMKRLKQAAVDYQHPEIPVVTTNPFICGRNYFNRYSAPEQEVLDDEKERIQILKEVMALKEKAVQYRHPEAPVITSDPYACGRNNFCRFSAPMIEEERIKILQEAQCLKEKAVQYRHPETPVTTSDPYACGRNYFTRFSAPTSQEGDLVEKEEREMILKDITQLKKLAIDYHHPEIPVVTTDPTVFGRNYFSRPSAPHNLQDVKKNNNENNDDIYLHHAHFDMDDELHIHHVEFDKNIAHHEEISEIREVPYGIGNSNHDNSQTIINNNDVDNNNKLSSSPECIMFFAKKTYNNNNNSHALV